MSTETSPGDPEPSTRYSTGPDGPMRNTARAAELGGAKAISRSFLAGVAGKLRRKDPVSGIVLESHLGIPGDRASPSPFLTRLRGLHSDEGCVEQLVNASVQDDPDRFAHAYFQKVKEGELGDGTNIFSADDAKLTFAPYNAMTASDTVAKNVRARYNTVLHAAATVVAKRAFLLQLDTLSPGSRVLVTNGGCGAGKSYALSHAARDVVAACGAVWDAAGEAAGTENQWVLDECRKRGLRVTFAYIHADPLTAWADQRRGVIARAERKGRMVNAASFVDSYVLGAKNFETFGRAHRDATDVGFIILDNRTTPTQLSELPPEALNIDGKDLYERVVAIIQEWDPNEAIRRGGTMCFDAWEEYDG